MGELATTVQERLRESLAERLSGLDWETEYRIAGTPVDVAGVGDSRRLLIELEWRRADPADNAAKLFRHLDEGAITADRVLVCQVFTSYYDLSSGGVSSKRKNATFVGRVAAETLDSFSYQPAELAIDPPKRGGELPDDWQGAVAETASRIEQLW